MRKWAGFSALAAITYVFYINLCQLVFQCGCGWLWTTAATHCNIHQKGVKHCPVCLLPTPEYLALLATILVAQGYLIWRGKWLWATLAFPLMAVIQMLLLGYYRGYWS